MNGRVMPHAHDLIWVRGEDAVEFLDGLLSQSVAETTVGSVTRSLLLSPQGKLRATLWLLRGEDSIGLVVEPGFADRVTGDLGRFRLRVDVEFHPEQRPLYEVWGEEARHLVASGDWVAAGDEDDDGALVADLPFINAALPRVLTTRQVGVPVPETEAEAARIALGEPKLDVDMDAGTIPQEAGLVDGAVDFSKGCYLGQELVARIDSRGHVNRHLRGLRLAAPAPPTATLTRDGREVGVVTSSATHAELGALALATVRREVDPGQQVSVSWQDGETTADVVELPMISDPFSGGS